MKNTLIKLLGGVTRSDYKAAIGDAFVEAVRSDCRHIEHERRDRYRAALIQITECETPSANATVRRMARIAQASIFGEGL